MLTLRAGLAARWALLLTPKGCGGRVCTDLCHSRAVDQQRRDAASWHASAWLQGLRCGMLCKWHAGQPARGQWHSCRRLTRCVLHKWAHGGLSHTRKGSAWA